MIVLGYNGSHEKDTLPVRAGWLMTRSLQTGSFSSVTHTESVLSGDNYKRCTIGSSSARDGGVRVKRDIALTKGNWLAIDVPSWDVALAEDWYVKHDGANYYWVGAANTVLLLLPKSDDQFFCNQAVGAPFLCNSDSYKPCQTMAIAISLPGSRDVTTEFFSD